MPFVILNLRDCYSGWRVEYRKGGMYFRSHGNCVREIYGEQIWSGLACFGIDSISIGYLCRIGGIADGQIAGFNGGPGIRHPLLLNVGAVHPATRSRQDIIGGLEC